jgi:hypothetical protein
MNIYFRRASELGNPLIDQFNFVEIGPENYKIEFRVNSTDPPTLQLSFERVENVLAQVYSAYHQYLRSQYEQHKDAFTVSKSFEDSAFQYETESELDAKEFIPQPDSDDFDLHVIDDAEENLNRISIAHTAKDYVEYVVQAEAAGEDYFALTWKHN